MGSINKIAIEGLTLKAEKSLIQAQLQLYVFESCKPYKTGPTM